MIAASCACDCRNNECDDHMMMLLVISDSVSQSHMDLEDILLLVKGL